MLRPTAPALLAAATLLVLAGVALADTTTTVYGPPGTGYVKETKAPDGTVVRRQHFREDHKLEKDARYDRRTGEPSGSTEHTYDEQGHRETTTERNGEGRATETSTFHDDGRLARHEKFDEFGMSEERREYTYDKQGRLTDINVFDENGEMKTTYHFGYHPNGKLADAEEMDHTRDPSRTVGQVFYRADGTVEELRGDASGALGQLGMSIDPNSHTTTGPNGERITVRHNADGTYDVTVVHPDKRVTLGHLRHGAGCYLGHQCPYEDSEGVNQTGSAEEAGADTASGAPISQLPPARTGGTPAHVPAQTPNVGAGQQHNQNIPIHRPTGRPGSY